MRLSRSNVISFSAVSLIIALTQGLGARAQVAGADSSAAGSDNQLADIVVTAQRRTENLQNVPISVTALSGATMTASGVDSQLTLPLLTPNLTYSANASNVAPYLRGIGTQFATAGLESSVAIYFDDLYTPRASGGLLDFSDIERVEVLKGPQGTLYGRNATGGAIRIITNDPSDKLEAGASVTYGRFDRIAFSGLVNLPISETLSARLAVDFENQDGYVRNIDPSRPALQGKHEIIALGKVLWKPSDRLRVKLSVDYSQKRDTDGLAFLPYTNKAPTQTGIALGGLPSPGFYVTTSNLFFADISALKENNENSGASLRIDYELDPFDFVSITGYRKAKSGAPADADATNIPLQEVREDANSDSYSQEFQLISHAGSALSWQAGLYGYHEKSSEELAAFGPAVGGIYYAGTGLIEVNSLAPYGQIGYDFSDQWNLTLGARETVEHKQLLSNEVTVGATSVDGAGIPTGPQAVILSAPSAVVDFKKFTPRVVLSFRPVDRVMLYTSYSKGFKSGGFNLPAFGVPDQVQPENLTAYELGWKTQFGSVRFDGAVFHYDDKDLQVQRVLPSTALQVSNAASAKLTGVEFDLAAKVSSGLELGAGGGYLQSKFDQYQGAGYVPAYSTAACAAAPGPACYGFSTESMNFAGKSLPLAPRFSGYVRGDYTVPLRNTSSLLLSAILNHTDHYYYDAGNTISEPGREILNGSIAWLPANDKYKISVYGSNITGTKYAVFRTILSTGGYYIPAPPAEYGVKFSYKY